MDFWTTSSSHSFPSATNDLQILASLEATSTHPIAHAVLGYAEEHALELLPVQSANNHAGKGIS